MFKIHTVDLTNLKKKIKDGKFVKKMRSITQNEEELDVYETINKDKLPKIETMNLVILQSKYQDPYDYEKEYKEELNNAIDTSVDKFQILDVLRARLEYLEENIPVFDNPICSKLKI